VQDGAVGRQQADGRELVSRALLLARGEQSRQRSTAQAEYFECPLDALCIGRVQARCRRRVDRCQFGVQRWPAA
jgi:hypothetical protein